MNNSPREARHPPLQEIVFTLLDACPSWCDYCFNAKNVEGTIASRSYRYAPHELGLDDVFRVIEAARPLGLEAIQISGGEPLLVKDKVFEIIRHAENMGVSVTLFTNGYIASPKVTDRLASAGLTSARISLGGPSFAAHAVHRHDPRGRESWNRILGAIGNFRKSGIRVGTLTPVTRSSLGLLKETAEKAFEYGATYAAFHRYIPSGIHSQDAACNLTAIEHMAALAEIATSRNEYGHARVVPDYGLFEFLSPHWSANQFVRPSKCGRRRLGILANGMVSTCACAAIDLGDIHSRDFNLSTLWQHHRLLHVLRYARPSGPCSHCKFWGLCQGACPSYSSAPDTSPLLPSVCPVVQTYRELLNTRPKDQAAEEACLLYDVKHPGNHGGYAIEEVAISGPARSVAVGRGSARL